MIIKTHLIGKKEIAELISDELIISNEEDGKDLVGNMYFQGFDTVIINKDKLTPSFFELKNKMAGEILQKFSTYGIRIIIIGDFKNIESESLKSFILESNKGRNVNFVSSLNEALKLFA